MEIDELRTFQQRLADTIAWCSPRIDVLAPATCLRTPDLRPLMRSTLGNAPAVSAVDVAHDADAWYDLFREGAQTAAAVEELSLKRAQRMRAAVPTLADSLEGGKLLLSAPSECVTDGGAEFISNGFLDLFEMSPWDTWLWCCIGDAALEMRFFDRCLLSWVPSPFVTLATEGIRYTPVGNLAWLDDTESPTSRQLQALLRA